MFVVIPFCHKDEWLAIRNIEWAKKLDGRTGKTAMVVHDTTVDGNAVKESAETYFEQVIELAYSPWPGSNKSWPVVQNFQFQQALTHISYNGPREPWLWWEPDATPVKPRWLDILEAEHEASGKPFMGHILSGDPWGSGRQATWMTGVGIYPYDLTSRSGAVQMAMNQPWDVLAGSEIVPHAHRANHIIQHIWERGGSPLSFKDKADAMSVLQKTTVLFHRCKDGSLIDALNGEPLMVTIAKSVREKVDRLGKFARTAMADGESTAIIQLGRFGDIVNALPAIRNIGNQLKKKPVVVVSKEFESVLDGVSFAEKEVYPGEFSDLTGGIAFAESRHKSVVVGQVWGKDIDVQQKCSSYNMDNWERLGQLSRWGWSARPVFDRRDRKRERALISKHVPAGELPLFLVSLTGGVTSRTSKGDQIKGRLKAKFRGKCRMVDLDSITADRVYDVIGLMEVADGIITSDTVWLHLANDTETPVAAFLSHKGEWMQTTPRCNCTLIMRDESDASEDKLHLWVESRIKSAQNRWIVQCCELHRPVPRRCKKAQSTWRALEHQGNWKVVRMDEYPRDTRQLGEKRAIPFLRDLLEFGLDSCGHDDILVMTNDDTIMMPEIASELRSILGSTVAASSNRVNVAKWDGGKLKAPHTTHQGRDLIAFRASWLRSNTWKIPDYALGICDWDIGMAAQVRWLAGEEWSIGDSSTQSEACELQAGLVLHEAHPPTWVDDRKSGESPGLVYNRRLVRKWADSHMPKMGEKIVWWGS